MKEEAKSVSKRITLADLFSCIAGFLSLMVNGVALLPILIEQGCFRCFLGGDFSSV